MQFVNLHVHSHYSLLDGLSKSPDIAKRCKELGQTACTLSDHGTISGAVSFMEAMKDENLKPIQGIELYISPDAKLKEKDNRKLSHLVVLAKNLQGWKQLIKIVSRSNDPDVFYHKPRLDLELLKEYVDGNLIAFSGHPGSTLANTFLESSIEENTAEAVERALKWDCVQSGVKHAELLRDIFGKENFFLEIQLNDSRQLAMQSVIAELVRQVGQKTGIKLIATSDCHYVKKEDAIDHRVILCSNLRTTMKDIYAKIRRGESAPLQSFFESDQYHIPSGEELLELGNTEEEIDNTNLVADMCEEYSILGPPRLPKYKWTEGLTESEYLRYLCREGWKRLHTNMWDKKIYGDRVKKELGVFDEANLNGYFLIVQDFVNWSRNQGWLIGPSRGSVGGSLVAYLTGISTLDPIPFNLLFERFYNAGRNTGGRVSLPDIDVDFPVAKRDEVVNYIRNRYGHHRVSQMVTFGRMQGRGALTEVFRVHNVCSFDQAKQISKLLPQEAEISDQLEATGETSIIRWTLENRPKDLSDYCKLEDGKFSGEYAIYFEQAIRLEGTLKTQGKHAAGVVISADNLNDVCPMVHDKNSNEKIAGMDMNDLEKMGHTKFDVLGVACLDKLMSINNLLKYGTLYA